MQQHVGHGQQSRAHHGDACIHHLQRLVRRLLIARPPRKSSDHHLHRNLPAAASIHSADRGRQRHVGNHGLPSATSFIGFLTMDFTRRGDLVNFSDAPSGSQSDQTPLSFAFGHRPLTQIPEDSCHSPPTPAPTPYPPVPSCLHRRAVRSASLHAAPDAAHSASGMTMAHPEPSRSASPSPPQTPPSTSAPDAR